MKISRRCFTNTFVGLSTTSLLPKVSFAKGSAKIVIIGGGAGGATAARHLKKNTPELDVTLVEMEKTYTTCFFSNWYIGGFRSFDQITHRYGKLVSDYGVNVIHAKATDVDTMVRSVTLDDGTRLSYDKLILSPGIDFRFEDIEGYDEEVAQTLPHAYKTGAQVKLLHDQVRALPQGGTVMIVAPPSPYRCPTGPYERASLIASYLSQHNPSAKIIILDPKSGYPKQVLFEEAWAKYYYGMIDWVGKDFTDGSIVRVDMRTMEAETGWGDLYQADVMNVIPAQKAGIIAQRAGVTDDTGWCPVTPGTFASRIAEHVYVIGDSSIADAMPKAAFTANGQARSVVEAVRAELSGTRMLPNYFNVACWSMLADKDTVKIGATYSVDRTIHKRTNFYISHKGESSEKRQAMTKEAADWYRAITKDMFG